jgi:hypothetical protein
MKFLFYGGIILFCGSIILTKSSYEKFNIERHGSLVKMKIESLPKSCIGAKTRYSVIFSYNGNIYNKQTRGDFCQTHYVGEYVYMKMLSGFEYILYPSEPAWFNLVSCGILGSFGLILAIFQRKKFNS